jgi:hypothetical protein
MPMDIAVQTVSGEERFRVENNQRVQMFELAVTDEPVSVEIDPDRVILRWNTIFTSVTDSPTLSMLTIQALTPNPAVNSLAIQYTTGETDRVDIEVYDVAGRRVLSRAVPSSPSGVRFEPLDTSSLATGVYFLRLKTSRDRATRKFVVVR